MNELLDIVDKIVVLIGGLDDQTFHQTIRSKLPQIVVVGAQSSGKSSVLRRISKVALPEASELCTRIATLVQMRRTTSVHPISVKLVDGSGKVLFEESVDSPSEVHTLVSKAQSIAVAESCQQFVSDKHVMVHVSSPDHYDLTLIDLPGFHQSDDDDIRVVNDMVSQYTGMEGSLVLHVVKADQDYDSILGNKEVRESASGDTNRITVLTHGDKVNVNDEAERARLLGTISKAMKHSSMTCAVLGAAQSDPEENRRLAHLSGIDARLHVGTEPLVKHLEKRMCEHMEMHFPRAIKQIEDVRDQITHDLGEVKYVSVDQKFFLLMQHIKDTYASLRPDLLNSIRKKISDTASEIYGDERSSALSNPTGMHWHERRKLIEEALEKRGLRNAVHADKQRVISVFGERYSDKIGKKLRGLCKEIKEMVVKSYNIVCDKTPKVYSKAATVYGSIMCNVVNDMYRDAQLYIDKLMEHNTHEDLCFTMNEHYLTSIIDEKTEEAK